MIKYDLKERFDEAIYSLGENSRYLTIEITKLGYPKFTESIPTAALKWDKDKKKVAFLFNPDFVKELSIDELKFAIAHEAVHLINGHLILIRDKMQEFANADKSNAFINKFMRNLNIAADCVVNDSLVHYYRLKECFTSQEDKIMAYYGEPTVGQKCHDLGVMDVYYLLKKQKEEEGLQEVENHNEWHSFFNEDGTLNRDFLDKLGEIVQEHMDDSSLSDHELGEIDKLKEALSRSSDSYARGVGRNISKEGRAIDGGGDKSLNWRRILTKVAPIKKHEDVWNKVNRKAISCYPDVIIPGQREKEKTKIFIAIDSSGSIDRKALSLFLSIVNNTPADYDIEAITFDTVCSPYEIRKNTKVHGGGGTFFHIVEDYIQEHYKNKYPEAVVVFTDGCGDEVNPQYPKRWCWLLYGASSSRYCKNMIHYNLKELLR